MDETTGAVQTFHRFQQVGIGEGRMVLAGSIGAVGFTAEVRHGLWRRGGSRVKRAALAGVLLCLMGSGCGIQDDFTRAANVLQSAIDQLANAPGNEKAILADTITQLDQFTEDAIKSADAAVKDVLAEGLGLANAVAQCQLDMIGIHGRDALIYVKQHILLGNPAPPPTPWVCLTNPTEVDVVQNSSGGPYVLHSPPEYHVFGTNFREQTLPEVDYLRTTGQVVTKGVVAAGLHTAYEIDLNLQTADFSGAQKGDFLSLNWPNSVTVRNRIDIILTPYQAPVVQRQVTRFALQQHAPGGNLFTQCLRLQDSPLSTFTVGSPWKIDQNLGDPGHPGVHEDVVNDNQQSINSLNGNHDYNYRAVSDTQVQITGTICSQANWGAGAIFDREYLVYQVHQ